MIVNNLNPQKYEISIIEYQHAEFKVEPVNKNIRVLPPIDAVDTPEKYSKTYQLYNTPEVLIDTYIKETMIYMFRSTIRSQHFCCPREQKIFRGFTEAYMI